VPADTAMIQDMTTVTVILTISTVCSLTLCTVAYTLDLHSVRTSEALGKCTAFKHLAAASSELD
jgi:Na+-transporting NADH:ubiquinone oxidoreductase subunit NqrC